MNVHQRILDSTFDEAEWVRARARRMALVVYLDFLILSVPLNLLAVLVRGFFPELSIPRGFSLLAFAALEVSLFRLRAWSPGCALLRVRLVDVREHVWAADQIWHGRLAYVARDQKERESWLTLALATWILTDASKSLVRWAMWNPPIPLFGLPTNEVVGALFSIASGTIEAAVATALFRVDVRAVMIGVPYYAIQLMSALMSWNLWPIWAKEMIVRRRAYQGLRVRAGEIERAQDITASLVTGGAAVLLILLLFALPRLGRRRRPDAGDNTPQ